MPATTQDTPPPPTSAQLLDGFTRLMHFLVEREADHLCGVLVRGRSPHRTNYRTGYHRRKIHTPLGPIYVRIPHLLYFHPRVSMSKRAKRLAPEILETLTRILTPASHSAFHIPHSAISAEASALIRLLWTLDLTAPQLAALAEKLTPLLEQWRAETNIPHP